ncbi:MAG: PD-(D/E)XK nuclease family protein [Candidatus Doudnabacteria bacterium]|nr:PD-(D/E)XK nuclease family protein [Candidatus Doudnabacteria bacterium]
MRHNMPYQLRPLGHTSASGLKDAISCEAKHGYTRNCIGVPEFPQPVAAVYGIVFHFFAEYLGRKFWNIASREGKLPRDAGLRESRKAANFLRWVLKCRIGPRGYKRKGNPPVKIRWFYPRKQLQMSDTEYQAAIKEKMGQMSGSLYNAIEAYRLSYTLPNRCNDMKFELPFKGETLRVVFPDGRILFVKLDGFIDWIRFFPSDQFEVADFKTGWIIGKYRDRSVVVEDIQMTIYDYICRVIYDAPPINMFIQPMDIPSWLLKEHGPYAMQKLRIPIEPAPRTQEHFDDLKLLAADVFEMANIVAEAHKYTQSQISEWEPRSSFGKKAGFEQNVRELRYIPRIGPGCETCKFIGLCQSDNAQDWKDYAAKHGTLDAEPVEDPFLVEPKIEVAQGQQNLIFDLKPRRSRYIAKSARQIRNEMLASKQFVPIKTLQKTKDRPTVTGMVPFFNKILEWMRETGDCPCLKQNLFPIHVAPYLQELYFGKISLAKVLSECKCQECPRRTQNKQEAS